MGNIVDAFSNAFRDYVADNVPSSGEYDPEKRLIRGIGSIIEQQVAAIGLSGSLSVSYQTKAELDSALGFAADSIGLVYSDATPSFNDIYVKIGAAGTGSWFNTTILQSIASALIGDSVTQAIAAKDAAVASLAGAQAAEARAIAAASTAESVVGPTYTSTAAGLAATANGQSFAVDNGDQTVTIYVNSAGVAAAQRTLATTTALLASNGSGLIGWIAGGFGAITRTLLARLRDQVFVSDYGATVANPDNATAIRNAMAANPGKTLFFPDTGDYVIRSSLGEMPEGTKFKGVSHRKTKIVRGYTSTDYMLIMGESCALESIWIDGNGASFTGGGVEVKLGTGRQVGRDVRIINFAGGIPLHFPCTGANSAQAAGSQSHWENLEAYRKDSSAGLGRYGVVHDDPGVGSAGHPIHFSNFNSSGHESIDFGACNNWYVVGSNLFGIGTSDRGVGMSIVSTRISQGVGGAFPITLTGNGSMTGVHCFPALIISDLSGSAWSFVGGYMNSGYVDNNPNSTTVVYDRTLRAYVPAWKGGATDVTIGNGSSTGSWQRHGTFITFFARLVIGSTTVIPAGGMTVSLPDKANVSIPAQCLVSGHITQGSTIYKFSGRIVSGELVARLERDTTGPINSTSPAALAAGDVIFVSALYSR